MPSSKDLSFIEGVETNSPDENLSIESDQYVYIGDKNTDGSFRLNLDGSQLKIDKRITGSWSNLWNIDQNGVVLQTGVAITAILDEDDLSTDSASAVPTQQSVKAYIDALTILQSNATGSNPGVNDDSSAGYSVNSTWTNTTTNQSFICVDSTVGAAIWNLIIDGTNAQTIGGNKTFSNDVIVQGDLTVNGTTTNVNTTDLDVTDKNITINNGGNDASSEGAGITVERTGADGSIIYEDALTSKWKAGALGSEVEVVNVSGAQTLTNKTIDYLSNTITNLPAGSSSNDLNYISNSGAETDTTGYSTYLDPTPGAAPTEGEGAGASITWTRTTADPLRGTGSFRLTKDAADRQGEGVAYDFILEKADRGNYMTVKFDYDCSTNYADGDIIAYIMHSSDNFVADFNVINIAEGSITDGVIRQFVSNFVADADDSDYRICFHVASTNANAYTVDFDTIRVEPASYLQAEPRGTYVLQDYTSVNSFGTSGQQYAGHVWELTDPEVSAGETLALWLFGDGTGAANEDESTNSYDLSSTGTVTAAGGIFGGSTGGFSVASGGINYYYNNTLWNTTPTNSYTAQFFVKFNSLATFNFLGSKILIGGDVRNLKFIVKSDGGIRFIVTDSSVTEADISSSAGLISTGEWHLITFCLDVGNGARIFLDGNTTAVASDAGAAMVSGAVGSAFSIGNFDGDPNASYNVDGTIGYCRVVDKVVDGDFIRQSYATRYTWTEPTYTALEADITFIEKDAGTGTPVETTYSSIAVNTTADTLYRQGGIYDKSTDTVRIEAVRA